MSAALVCVSFGDVWMSEEDRRYVTLAATERGQSWQEFATEALLEWAAR